MVLWRSLVLCVLLVYNAAAQDDDVVSDVDSAAGVIQESVGVNCGAGYQCVVALKCLPCDYGYYKQGSGVGNCVPCPEDCVTLRKGATSYMECVSKCPEGYEDAGVTCIKCRPGFYKPSWGNVDCSPCPNSNYDDSLLGMVDESECYTTAASSRPDTFTPQSPTMSDEWETIPDETITDEMTTMPHETTTMPDETTTMPEETTMPDEMTTMQDEMTTMQDETTTMPDETTTIPDETTTTPDATTTPDETTTSQGADYTALVGAVLIFSPDFEQEAQLSWVTPSGEINPNDFALYTGIGWAWTYFRDEIEEVETFDFENVTFTYNEENNTYTAECLVRTSWSYSPVGFPAYLTTRSKAVASGEESSNAYSSVTSYVNVHADSIRFWYEINDELPDTGCPTTSCSMLTYSSDECLSRFCDCMPVRGWQETGCAPGTIFDNTQGMCYFGTSDCTFQ